MRPVIVRLSGLTLCLTARLSLSVKVSVQREVLEDFVYPQELMGGERRHYDIRAAHIAGDGLTCSWRDVTERQSRREIAEQQRTDRERLVELERFQRPTVGRELKMIELKQEIEYLKKHRSAGGSDPDDQVEPD